jgi:hypothetical protein
MLYPALVAIGQEMQAQSRPKLDMAVSVLKKALADEDATEPVRDLETGCRYVRKEVPQQKIVKVRIEVPQGQELSTGEVYALNGQNLPVTWLSPDDKRPRLIEATMMASAVQAIVGGEA